MKIRGKKYKDEDPEPQVLVDPVAFIDHDELTELIEDMLRRTDGKRKTSKRS